MVRIALVLVLTTATAAAQSAPGVLQRGIFVGTLTAEVEMSQDTAGDPTSLAPDLSAGVTDELTLSVLHSTFGRTGFRGNAGAGICLTDACAHTYDNAGLEAAYGLVSGRVALAANAGVHATSFDRGHYAAKVGARFRALAGTIAITSLPSVLIAVTDRDAEVKNLDRIFVPVNVSTQVAPGLTLGLITGFKSPLDDVGESYEIAAGAFASYAVDDSIALSASWVHGKLLGGDKALPGDSSGVDSRALQLWVTITRSAYPRYR